MKLMTIGRLAIAAGTHVTTVRFYERIGLLPAPSRSTGGHRLYSHDHLQRLMFIRRARELEFSIDAIKEMLPLAGATRASCQDVHQLAAVHLDELRNRIAGLTRLEARLADAMSHCAGGSLSACAVLQLLQPPG